MQILVLTKLSKRKGLNFIKTTFGAMNQPHISKILLKKTRVLALLMFYETRKKPKKVFKVLSCVIYTMISNYICIDYLESQ